ncbi:50S ribosomal protein L12P [mine drainage metagenome]|uniref:50S ribosomal protein L12P n=1 Tax=mine drainage metagenome TaxID=410659 RepID=T1BV07_9ZZZZ
MEYVYGALLLHSAGSEIDEEKLKKVLEEAGVKPDESRLKALVSSMKGVNIEEVNKERSINASCGSCCTSKARGKERVQEEGRKEG